MKKIFTFLLVMGIYIMNSQCSYTMDILSQNGYTITCANPTINLIAIQNSNYFYPNHLWTGPSFTTNLPYANVTQPGIYTLTISEGITNCTLTTTVSIGINTAVPSSSVFPNSASVTCNNPVTFTAMALTPTSNIMHSWYVPVSPFPNGNESYLSINVTEVTNFYSGPGVYTHKLKDLTNGCFVTQTVSVTSPDAYPTFSLGSSTNYSFGCAPLNQTTISIINPVSTQTPPATCSYTFMAPTFTGIVTPSVILGNNSSTVTTSPGTWSIIVQDNSNFCRTMVDVTVSQNTLVPNVIASIPANTLTCNNPTFLTQGFSSTKHSIISWQVPILGQPLTTTLIIGDISNGPPTSTIALFYANFTVVATNSINGCQTSSIIPIYQDFRAPKSIPAITGTPTSFCKPGDVVTLNSNNSYVTSAGPSPSIIVNSWMGPAPQTSASTSTYSAYVTGNYSLTVEDSYNGCKTTSIINVPTNAPRFGLQGTAPSSSASCDGTVIVTTQIPNGYTLSATTGLLDGTTISNLCYGWLKVCMTFTAGECYACDSILINAATSIREINFKDEILIYPNPSNGTFYIKNTSGKSATIKIFNVEGRQVSVAEALEATGSGASTLREPQGPKYLEIKNLNAGIYFVEVNIDGSIIRKKIVVLK
ncbi:MAG: T9SS type A sorting domain-containing protein [Sphingobacteriaceae bacterium]|nr:T9SS type A sorting domain-containing protein [Sphingobacteriaceae bacterium]